MDRENQGATAGQLERLDSGKTEGENRTRMKRSWMTVTTITTRFRKAENKGGNKGGGGGGHGTKTESFQHTNTPKKLRSWNQRKLGGSQRARGRKRGRWPFRLTTGGMRLSGNVGVDQVSRGRKRRNPSNRNRMVLFLVTKGIMQTGWIRDKAGNWYYCNTEKRREIRQNADRMAPRHCRWKLVLPDSGRRNDGCGLAKDRRQMVLFRNGRSRSIHVQPD